MERAMGGAMGGAIERAMGEAPQVLYLTNELSGVDGIHGDHEHSGVRVLGGRNATN